MDSYTDILIERHSIYHSTIHRVKIMACLAEALTSSIPGIFRNRNSFDSLII